jgi:streptomycin 6-kinase
VVLKIQGPHSERYSEIEAVQLHGDIHHDNILMAGDDGWLAIDPQGVIGPAFLESARFIQNHCFPETGTLDMPDIVRTVEYIAGSLGQPCTIVFRALLILHTLSACWNGEMHEDEKVIAREQEQCDMLLTMI